MPPTSRTRFDSLTTRSTSGMPLTSVRLHRLESLRPFAADGLGEHFVATDSAHLDVEGKVERFSAGLDLVDRSRKACGWSSRSVRRSGSLPTSLPLVGKVATSPNLSGGRPSPGSRGRFDNPRWYR